VRGRVRHRSESAEFDRIRQCFVAFEGAPSRHRAEPSLPSSRRTPAQRRRRVLIGIVVAMVATLVAALVVGSRVAWGLHLLGYDVLIGYVGLLARSSDQKDKRRYEAAPTLRSVPTGPAYANYPPEYPPEYWPEVVPALLQAASR
jgi:hypothetical protein